MDRDRATEPAVALADELRHIAELLNVTEPADEVVTEAHELARTIRERLDGPRQPRWYEGSVRPGDPTPASRRAYLDLSPVRGRLNPGAPPLVLREEPRADGGAGLVGELELGRRYEGPPHGVHGGWVAAIFDEALGAAQLFTGRTGMTATLKVKYRQVTPVERPLRIEAWVHEHRGRRIVAKATCHADGRLTAEAEGVFLVVDFAEVDRQLGDGAA